MTKVVVDTDLLVGHALGGEDGQPSDLRQLLQSHFCYTTVFHAVEAFSLCRNEQETAAVEGSMHAMKILGLNAKSGKTIGALFASIQKRRDLHLLAAGLCIESRLPLVTRRTKLYAGIPGLTLLRPEKLEPPMAGRSSR